MPEDGKAGGSGKRNIKLTIEYDGTDFSGWQRQPSRRTVQQHIEEAIATVTGERVHLLASGRTDAGVHSEGQAANFRTASTLTPRRFVGAINANIDFDAAVIDAREVPWSFHAVRDADAKLYRYRISTRPVRPVIKRRFVHYVKGTFDVEACKRAARHLVGTHDFNSFRAEGRVVKNAVRTIRRIDFEQEPDGLAMWFEGNGFLYMMVRIIVGTLLEVARGALRPDDIPAILAARDRSAAGPTAPPRGLCLVEVHYPDEVLECRK
ncbi:MAG: tRNA pseudouridine(38-40) synthase TruA [Planctomycetes bacterium]|nr:tRNA pseudouridine(38-40) synthase TruA [Planctomycetota bacterium]